MARPTLLDIVYGWRRSLTARVDPPIREYVQSNELINVELVSTSQTKDTPVESVPCGEKTAITTAVAIASSKTCSWVMVQAKNANTDTLLVGNSGNQSWELQAGGSVVIPIDNIGKIIVKAASGTQAANYMYGV